MPLQPREPLFLVAGCRPGGGADAGLARRRSRRRPDGLARRPPPVPPHQAAAVACRRPAPAVAPGAASAPSSRRWCRRRAGMPAAWRSPGRSWCDRRWPAASRDAGRAPDRRIAERRHGQVRGFLPMPAAGAPAAVAGPPPRNITPSSPAELSASASSEQSSGSRPNGTQTEKANSPISTTQRLQRRQRLGARQPGGAEQRPRQAGLLDLHCAVLEFRLARLRAVGRIGEFVDAGVAPAAGQPARQEFAAPVHRDPCLHAADLARPSRPAARSSRAGRSPAPGRPPQGRAARGRSDSSPPQARPPGRTAGRACRCGSCRATGRAACRCSG